MPRIKKIEQQYAKFFKKRKISSVIFDMDNTLVDTRPYYIKVMNSAGSVISKTINKYTENPMDEVFVMERVNEIAFDTYNKDSKPRLITDQYVSATKAFLKEIKLSSKTKQIVKTVDTLFDDFYNQPPNLYPSTLRILNIIDSTEDINISIYSHAQHNWTKIKVEKIQELYKKKYKKQIELKFVTTPIEESKDSLGWKRAAEIVDTTLENSLVIGDNWHADILPAVYAGCKNLIWINRKRSLTKERTDEIGFIKKKAKANVYIVNNISGVKQVLLSN